MATGYPFAVDVLFQGLTEALPDEREALQINASEPVYARHVCLTLDGQPVVIARSTTRQSCARWQPILSRGNRSLGLTLFGGLPGLVRDDLQFATLTPQHPLHALTGSTAPLLSARRCRFTLADAPLLVCEVFLPALEDYLT